MKACVDPDILNWCQVEGGIPFHCQGVPSEVKITSTVCRFLEYLAIWVYLRIGDRVCVGQ